MMSCPDVYEDFYDWNQHARPKQRIPEGDWRIWLILAGRGFGKTRTGAETVRRWVEQGFYRRIALLGQTEHDVRSVMIEGESGLLNVFPPDAEAPFYQPSLGQITWPRGAKAQTYGADRYDKLRGPQFDAAWVDELAKFRNVTQVWDQLMFCLRLGSHPRVVITTTPRPLPLIQSLCQRSDVVVTRGSTYENADHLSKTFLEEMKARYEGTPLGDQELHAQIVQSTRYTLWPLSLVQQAWGSSAIPSLDYVVVGVDPSVSDHDQGDETGIVVAGRDAQGCGYILGDYSVRGPSTLWIPQLVHAYRTHQAHCVIAEVNQGGGLIEHLLRASAPDLRFKPVRALKGKYQRAEPIAALYRQRKIHHTCPLPALEAQMHAFQQDSAVSPDRLDALVWALTELFLTQEGMAPPSPCLWGL